MLLMGRPHAKQAAAVGLNSGFGSAMKVRAMTCGATPKTVKGSPTVRRPDTPPDHIGGLFDALRAIVQMSGDDASLQGSGIGHPIVSTLPST